MAGRLGHPPTDRDIRVAETADNTTITQYSDIGVTVTVTNSGRSATMPLTLTDRLALGGNLSWDLDRQSGINGCTTQGRWERSESHVPLSTLHAGI